MENNKKSLAYRMGQLFGTVLVGCLMVILIALTLRLLGWIIL